MNLSRRAALTGLIGGAVAAASSCAQGRSSAAERRRSPGSTPPAGTSDTSGPASTSTTTSTAAPGTARFVSSGPPGRDQVALTFHTDGDLGLAQQLLDALSSGKATITAFVVGSWLQQHPDWAKKLLDHGHELANHTQNHRSFPKLTPVQMEAEIVECRDVLQRLTGTPGAFFRPSGTANGTDRPSSAVLDAAGSAGYATVLGFDVDPLDYRDPGTAAVVSRTLATVGPGSILSLHFGHPGTIAALPRILDGIRAKGLEPVTASKLLG